MAKQDRSRVTSPFVKKVGSSIKLAHRADNLPDQRPIGHAASSTTRGAAAESHSSEVRSTNVTSFESIPASRDGTLLQVHEEKQAAGVVVPHVLVAATPSRSPDVASAGALGLAQDRSFVDNDMSQQGVAVAGRRALVACMDLATAALTSTMVTIKRVPGALRTAINDLSSDQPGGPGALSIFGTIMVFFVTIGGVMCFAWVLYAMFFFMVSSLRTTRRTSGDGETGVFANLDQQF